MKLELCMLIFIHSLQVASFTLYLDILTVLTPWFFVLDHTNYTWWIPVHLKDIAELSNRHPEVAKQLNSGKFVVQKTKQVFSGILIGQADEQNNALINRDGGAVGLTDNPSALQHWTRSG